VFNLKQKWGNKKKVGLGRNSFIDTFKQEPGDLFELCKDDERLFNNFVWELYFKDNPKEAAVDPRCRDDSHPNDRCRFHGHRHEICYRDKK
jgi:hypothetical protein